jgi:hypothetical protein
VPGQRRRERANDWDEWLLTKPPLDEEATRKLARKDEAEKKENPRARSTTFPSNDYLV